MKRMRTKLQEHFDRLAIAKNRRIVSRERQPVNAIQRASRVNQVELDNLESYRKKQAVKEFEPPRSDNILHAPNVVLGRSQLQGTRFLNNLYRGPDDTVKPIVNKDGDYFTDTDPLSGRPILRKRIGERWLTNRSKGDSGSKPRQKDL